MLDLYAWCYGKRYDPNQKACLGCPKAVECREETMRGEQPDAERSGGLGGSD